MTKKQAEWVLEKLSTIEPGAQVNVIEEIRVNGRTLPLHGKYVNILYQVL